ncbi:uncharacterized protein LOC102722540 [Oryza brachyantha]|uniref:uncharacterized protein LOC102722540 n=1 Tax=Oryza brachyantha TaxID=4533 RepID=UPI001ADB6BEA|nr:uncharacterized protein LOC102722540 [Oryza brachyantha]
MGRLLFIPLLACFFSTLLLGQVRSATLMKVSTTPIFPTIPRDRSNDDFQVLLRVEAPPAADGHIPIDVVAVLDVSGSMNFPAAPAKKNQASRLDVLKTAMKFVIRKLHSEDRLSIVAFNDKPVKEYSTDGFLEISGQGRSTAGNKVDKLQAGGGTDILSGLVEANKILDARANKSRIGFIVLLTDGNSSTPIHGAVSNYPVHTFGLCTEHEPEPLFKIAKQSGGTYSFVDDDNLDKITSALALCAGGLNSVVAVGTHLVLKASNGVKIVKIISGGYANSFQETTGKITIGALYAGEVKNFIVHLRVPVDAESAAGAGNGLCCNQRELLVASLESQSIEVASDVLIVERPAAATAVLPKLPSSIVVNHIFRFKVVKMVETFIEKEILSFTSPVGDLRAKLLVKWEELVQVHQFWVGLELEGVHGEIHAVANTLQTTTQGLTGGAVRPSSVAAYIFSWLSSYQMQRPTAMGSAGKVVDTFVTLQMHLTLQASVTFLSGDTGSSPSPAADIKCEYSCVEKMPPAKHLFVASGHGDNSFHFNPDFQGIVSLDDINEFMSKIYQGMVIANNLKQCNSSRAVA